MSALFNNAYKTSFATNAKQPNGSTGSRACSAIESGTFFGRMAGVGSTCLEPAPKGEQQTADKADFRCG